jgi:hypothetical protein
MADDHHVFCEYLFEALSEAVRKYEIHRRGKALYRDQELRRRMEEISQGPREQRR